MYLLLSHGNLEGYQFADSKSLMAFEEISQGARRWGESPPDEMTARTETSGGRVAGFLHARMRSLSDDSLIDLLVPDLPGEWSDTLIDSNRTDRLDFVRSADVVWLFVNGSELRQPALRMHTLNRTKLLLRRVADMLDVRKPPIKIVVSHADAGDLPEQTVQKLNKMGEDVGVDLEIIDIASFSDADGKKPGSGISKLIDASRPVPLGQPPEWPTDTIEADRFALRYTEAGKP